jgi:hypothetical protein
VAQRPTGLTGAAGEYYVAAELSRRGWLATVTVKNAPGTDVLAQDPETKRTVAIQTKTSSGGIKFTLGERDERTYARDPGWVVLVGLAGDLERPSFYVVPRCHLAAMLYAQHRWWLDEPGKRGQLHTDNPRRGITGEEVQGYLERWDLLAREPERAPYLGDPWYPELLETKRWRPEHLPRAMRPRGKG